MINNNWIEEFIFTFDRDFPFFKTEFPETRKNLIRWSIQVISNLLTKKDQEHKADLEMIKGELKEYFEGLIHVASPRLTGNNIISILDSHINKLNTE